MGSDSDRDDIHDLTVPPVPETALVEEVKPRRTLHLKDRSIQAPNPHFGYATPKSEAKPEITPENRRDLQQKIVAELKDTRVYSEGQRKSMERLPGPVLRDLLKDSRAKRDAAVESNAPDAQALVDQTKWLSELSNARYAKDKAAHRRAGRS